MKRKSKMTVLYLLAAVTCFAVFITDQHLLQRFFVFSAGTGWLSATVESMR